MVQLGTASINKTSGLRPGRHSFDEFLWKDDGFTREPEHVASSFDPRERSGLVERSPAHGRRAIKSMLVLARASAERVQAAVVR
jgi:hypothetical protein